MTFSYFDYLFNNLILPLGALFFVAVLVVRPLAAGGIQAVFQDRRLVVMLVVVILVAVVLVLTLVQGGGIHLSTDRASQAETVTGTITEISKCNPFLSPRYSAYEELSNGYRVTVEGTENTAITVTVMAKGTLAVGNRVTVTYLPKSGMALAIG